MGQNKKRKLWTAGIISFTVIAAFVIVFTSYSIWNTRRATAREVLAAEAETETEVETEIDEDTLNEYVETINNARESFNEAHASSIQDDVDSREIYVVQETEEETEVETETEPETEVQVVETEPVTEPAPVVETPAPVAETPAPTPAPEPTPAPDPAAVQAATFESLPKGPQGCLYVPACGIVVPLQQCADLGQAVIVDYDNLAVLMDYGVSKQILDHVQQNNFGNMKTAVPGQTIAYIVRSAYDYDTFVCDHHDLGQYGRYDYETLSGSPLRTIPSDLQMLTCHGGGIWVSFWRRV